MQMPQEAASAKYGMHLSKSTYHRFSPRTNCFSGRMAEGGHAFVQIWQTLTELIRPKLLG